MSVPGCCRGDGGRLPTNASTRKRTLYLHHAQRTVAVGRPSPTLTPLPLITVSGSAFSSKSVIAPWIVGPRDTYFADSSARRPLKAWSKSISHRTGATVRRLVASLTDHRVLSFAPRLLAWSKLSIGPRSYPHLPFDRLL